MLVLKALRKSVFNESAGMINALIHSVDKYGNIDFSQAICITVMHGWDADCSGAMMGGLAGVMAGKHAIPKRWTDPLQNKYYSCIPTDRDTKMDALAERLFNAIKYMDSSSWSSMSREKGR